MSDKMQPKAKKGVKHGAVKEPKKPKLDPSKLHGIGHNSGQVIPELVNLVDELLASAARQKREGQLQRDLRNRAKSEFGVLAGPLSHEIRLRKMDGDVRVQFESGHGDLKQALGYQPELDFQDGVPTKASAKAQPPEAQLSKPKAHPKNDEEFEVEEDEEEMEPDPANGGDMDDDDEEENEPEEKPVHHPKKDVIVREG